MKPDRDFATYDPFDSSDDTAEEFRDRAIRLRALGYENAAAECDEAADKLEGKA